MKNSISKNKRGKYFLLFIVFLFVLYVFIKFCQRPLHKHTFYTKVTVDMMVDGSPVHMERIITCKTFPDIRYAPINDIYQMLFNRRSAVWAAWPAAFGQQLDDGSAVMVHTPYKCEREKYKDHNGIERFRIQRPDMERVPLIGWTKNSSQVDELELYVNKVAMDNSKSRIQELNVNIELLEGSNHASAELDGFEWFSGVYHNTDWFYGPFPGFDLLRYLFGVEHNPNPYLLGARDVRFATIAGWVLEPEDWQGKFEELDCITSEMTEPGPIKSPFGIYNEIVGPKYVPERKLPNNLVNINAFKSIGTDRIGYYSPYRHFKLSPIGSGIIDFPIEENIVLLDEVSPYGVLSLKRINQTQRKTYFDPERTRMWQGPLYELSGQQFNPKDSNYSTFYDPDTRSLYVTKRFVFKSWVLPDHHLRTKPTLN